MPKKSNQIEREALQAQTSLTTNYLSDLRFAYYSTSFSSTLASSAGTWRDHMISGLQAQTGLTTKSASTLWDAFLTAQGVTAGSLQDRKKTYFTSLISGGGATQSSYSIDFESSSSQGAFITDANQTGLDLSTTFTIEAWLKYESQPGLATILAKDNDSATSSRSYNWYTAGGSAHYGLACDGSGFDLYDAGTVPSIGVWEHWALVCDVGNASATTFEWFKNGVSQGNGSSVIANNISAINNSSTDVELGFRTQSVNYFDGLMHDFRVWNVARTQQQISDNYQTALNGNESGLVAYWKFDQNLNDETSNANNLTGKNTPTYSTDIPTWS